MFKLLITLAIITSSFNSIASGSYIGATLDTEIYYPAGNYGIYIVDGFQFSTIKQIPNYSNDYPGTMCSLYKTDRDVKKSETIERQDFMIEKDRKISTNVHVGKVFYPNDVETHVWNIYHIYIQNDLYYMYCSKKGNQGPSAKEVYENLKGVISLQ